MSKTSVYCRVSTLDQEKGLKSQEHAIREYLSGHGIKDATWYRDRISGSEAKRPALDKLQQAIFMGQVDTVIVWKLDRLTRKGPRDGLVLIGKWLDKGIRVVSITERFDWKDAEGEMIAGILFSVARMFRENLRENIKRGMAKARADGKLKGKQPGKWVEQIAPLLKQGLTKSEVARRLGKSRQAVYNALERAQ